MSKVYDTFCLFNELDMLEIRINILDEHVDKFVICESPRTFSGESKPLYYEENKERFAKWHDKIIHHVVGMPFAQDPFRRAFVQKEAIMDVLRKECVDDDIVYFGDVDEIWTSQKIEDDKVYKLRQLCYSYYLNMCSSEDWRGTIVGKWSAIRENGLNENRANPENILEEGGWHFTNMGGVDQIRAKLNAYDHQEMNTADNRDKIGERMENGEDYVGRKLDWQGKPFTFWVDETELPLYLKENKEQWKHLFKSA